MKSLTGILSFLGVAALTACSSDGCLNNQSAIPLADFYSSETDSPISLNIIEISGVNVPNDSILLAGGTVASSVYLPMRSTKPSTSWCLHYTQENISMPELNDTVTFIYDSEAYFASYECGAMYRYHITEVRNTTHLLDSVAVLDSLVTNVDKTYMRFYFRTAPEPETPDENDEE